VEARIIGLKGCGKSTLMAALGGHADSTVATVKVGDPRIRALSEIFKPKKTTFAEFRVRVAVWPEATGRKGEMDKYLDALAGAQVFLHVLRAFDNPVLGEPMSPAGDLERLDHEFLLADLIAIERAFERAKKQKLSDLGRRSLAKARDALEIEVALRDATGIEDDELAFLRPYGFLTLVPQVVLVNLEAGSGEAGATQTPANTALASARDVAAGRQVLAFPFSDAADVAGLSSEEQQEFSEALGLPGIAADLVTRAAFEQMGLISFFTAGEDEVRAWPIRRGSSAQKAAGAIHSDIERGFIRAEVVSYDQFMERKTLKACRDAGVLRLEGKTYAVADGDIIEFRFNV
jgi:ribosome-binding ATPase